MPPDARQWLPRRHLAWALLELAGGLDLAGFQARYRLDGKGRPAYDPVMMVTLVMYCYCKGIRSSRGIELATFDDVGARVICGNLHPDHATIARFAARHEQELKGLLAVPVAACAREGLVSVDVVAGDGTKVKASASMAANKTAAALDADIAALEEVIAAEAVLWVAEHLAADAADGAAGGEPPQAGPGGQAGGTGRKRTAHTLARRRAAKEHLDADAAVRAGKAEDKQQARAARLAGRAARKEEEAARLTAEADRKLANWQARAAACPRGKKPSGGTPGAPEDNRDVRRVRAAAGRLRERAAAAAAADPAGPGRAGPGKELKVNLTDPGSAGAIATPAKTTHAARTDPGLSDSLNTAPMLPHSTDVPRCFRLHHHARASAPNYPNRPVLAAGAERTGTGTCSSLLIGSGRRWEAVLHGLRPD
jgi:transposase